VVPTSSFSFVGLSRPLVGLGVRVRTGEGDMLTSLRKRRCSVVDRGVERVGVLGSPRCSFGGVVSGSIFSFGSSGSVAGVAGSGALVKVKAGIM
jgi:hypothetical protein